MPTLSDTNVLLHPQRAACGAVYVFYALPLQVTLQPLQKVIRKGMAETMSFQTTADNSVWMVQTRHGVVVHSRHDRSVMTGKSHSELKYSTSRSCLKRSPAVCSWSHLDDYMVYSRVQTVKVQMKFLAMKHLERYIFLEIHGIFLNLIAWYWENIQVLEAMILEQTNVYRVL